MTGETDLNKLIKNLSPKLNKGDYVFTSVDNKQSLLINRNHMIGEFKEAEGTTIILEKSEADKLKLSYDYVAAWITLEVHSSLHAVGLTALFSDALAKKHISCNVVAGYYHDHIFIDKKEADKALSVLNHLGEYHEK